MINRSRSNVRSYARSFSISKLPSHFTHFRRSTHAPLLIIGNLLVSNPAGVNDCANTSSRYPNRTALNRDTLASLSVFCTTLSLEADDASGPTPPPRDRSRPGPPLRRRVLRLGICGADILGSLCVFSQESGSCSWGNIVRGDLPRSGDIRGRAELFSYLSSYMNSSNTLV